MGTSVVFWAVLALMVGLHGCSAPETPPATVAENARAALMERDALRFQRYVDVESVVLSIPAFFDGRERVTEPEVEMAAELVLQEIEQGTFLRWFATDSEGGEMRWAGVGEVRQEGSVASVVLLLSPEQGTEPLPVELRLERAASEGWKVVAVTNARELAWSGYFERRSALDDAELDAALDSALGM